MCVEFGIGLIGMVIFRGKEYRGWKKRDEDGEMKGEREMCMFPRPWRWWIHLCKLERYVLFICMDARFGLFILTRDIDLQYS